jgi:hypothetical protein
MTPRLQKTARRAHTHERSINGDPQFGAGEKGFADAESPRRGHRAGHF